MPTKQRSRPLSQPLTEPLKTTGNRFSPSRGRWRPARYIAVRSVAGRELSWSVLSAGPRGEHAALSGSAEAKAARQRPPISKLERGGTPCKSRS